MRVKNHESKLVRSRVRPPLTPGRDHVMWMIDQRPYFHAMCEESREGEVKQLYIIIVGYIELYACTGVAACGEGLGFAGRWHGMC